MAVNISVTLPEDIVTKIDLERGDINRSKFLLRLIQKAYPDNARERGH